MSTKLRMGVAVAVVVVATGAGTSRAGPPDKTGGTVTLTLANPEPLGRPSSQIAERFAARAKALSKGTIVVKVTYDAGKTSDNTPVGRVEANLLGLVRSGKAALAIAPTRAFQPQGVKSFQALQAPFLITTGTGMARVTTGPIATALESGLSRIGLVGLGLAPEGLRRPFGFRKVLATPADFAGTKIRAIPNKATWSLLHALGATPVDMQGDEFIDAVAKGSVQGAESSLAIAADDDLLATTFTAGNLVFFPKVDALIANDAALGKLKAEQRAILRRAATDARSWAVANLTEQRARNDYCEAGGTIVNVPSSSLEQLRAKTAPLLAAMRRDPVTRKLVDEIGPLGASGAPLRTCRHGGATSDSGGPTVSKLIPPGVYRASFKTEEFMAAGETSLTHAQANAGTWTLTVTADGLQQIHIDSPYPRWTGTCAKRKMYLRNGLVAIVQAGGCAGTNYVAWKLVPGGLRFTRTRPADPVSRILFLSRIWKTVG